MRCKSATSPWRRYPKWKSVPTTTSRGAEHPGEQLRDEVFGRLLAARLVEREHEAFVDRTRGLEQLELVVERRQQLRRRAGAHDLGRMTVEGEHGRREPASGREVAHDPQHGLVPAVHAVERADCDRAPAQRPAHLARIAPDDHADS